MRSLSRWMLAAVGTLLVASACSSFRSTAATEPDASAPPDGASPPADASEIQDSAPPVVDGAVDTPDATPDATVEAGVPCTVTCRSHYCDDDGGCHPLVFVTADSFNGELDSPADAGAPAYGTARGDYLCNQIGADGGTAFIALLSTSGHDVKTQITGGGGAHRPVRRHDGVIVASSYFDIFSAAGLDAGINLTNAGAEVDNDEYVWTGTTTTGIAASNDCLDWTSTFPADSAEYGLVGETDGRWVQVGTTGPQIFCPTPQHLYCFEIVP